MVGILKYLAVSVFVCAWIFWMLNVMWLDDYVEERDSIQHQVQTLRNDPDTKMKKELLRLALDYEQTHSEILSWPLDIALEHFIADERKFRARSFLNVTSDISGIDHGTVREAAIDGIGGVFYVPIDFKVEPVGGSLSYTYFSQYLTELLSLNQIVFDTLQIAPNDIAFRANFLGTFQNN